jgi:hypothetical protein
VAYFRNQVHRMDYPSSRARGWQIGSGPVEAACKMVVGQRLEGAGMRWGHEGADGVCHLRALLLSGAGQWEAFSAHRRKAGWELYPLRRRLPLSRARSGAKRSCSKRRAAASGASHDGWPVEV